MRRRLAAIMAAMLMALVAMLAVAPKAALAAPHDVVWVTDSPSNHIAGTTLYITNVSSANGTVSSVSGDVYADGTDIKARPGASSGAWTLTYPNAGYDVNGRQLTVRMSCQATFPDADFRPTTDMQLFSIWGGTSCDGGVHVAIRIRIDVLDSHGNQIPGTFGMRFDDLDVPCPQNSLYNEGIELVSGCQPTIWIGEAMPESEHKSDYEEDAPNTPGQRMNVYEHDGHTIVNASHYCASLNDSSFACIGVSGTEIIWRGGDGLGSGVGILSSTTIYPDSPAPTKQSVTPSVATNGTATFRVTKWLPDVVGSNQAASIVVSDTFAKCLDPSRATYSVTRTDADGNVTDVTGNWTSSVSGQTLSLSARDTSHGHATLSHTFTISVPVRAGYDFDDLQLAWNGTALRLSNAASVRIVPKSGSTVDQSTNTTTVDVTGSVTPRILLQKADPDLGAGHPQGGATLAGASYKLEYWTAWSASGSPTSTSTWVTNAAGELVLSKGSWPYGDASWASLPFGTYRVTETSTPAGYSAAPQATFQVRRSNSSGSLVTSNASGFSEGTTTASTGFVSTESSIVRGPVKARVVDADIVDAQGDAHIAGAVMEIVNSNPNPVVVGGVTYAPGAVVATLTTPETGRVQAAGLPYGTYTVRQKSAPDGYTRDSTTRTAIVTTTDGSDIQSSPLRETIWRGSVNGEKVDADSRTRVPQGDATLAGATFDIINRSLHPVYVNGATYAVGDVCLTMMTTNEAAIACAARTLPYGTYDLVERTGGEPVGYRHSDLTIRFQIRSDGQIVT